MIDILISVLRVTAGMVYLGISFVLFGLACLVCLPSRAARIRICNVYGHITGRVILWLAGAKVPLGAAEQARLAHPAIYVSNHTSPVDIFIGIWLAPIGTVGTAKKEVVWYPFFGQLYAISGHLLVDRQNHGNALATFRTAAVLIRKYGIGVWLWPEGTRSADGRLRPFKKGFAHLALATGLPIVPVVVSNAHRNWSKGSIVLHPTEIGIKVLDPIPTTSWRLETIDEHVAEVQALFEEALPEDQRPVWPAQKIAANA